jgi:hypothetical protein
LSLAVGLLLAEAKLIPFLRQHSYLQTRASELGGTNMVGWFKVLLGTNRRRLVPDNVGQGLSTMPDIPTSAPVSKAQKSYRLRIRGVSHELVIWKCICGLS